MNLYKFNFNNRLDSKAYLLISIPAFGDGLIRYDIEMLRMWANSMRLYADATYVHTCLYFLIKKISLKLFMLSQGFPL